MLSLGAPHGAGGKCPSEEPSFEGLSRNNTCFRNSPHFILFPLKQDSFGAVKSGVGERPVERLLPFLRVLWFLKLTGALGRGLFPLGIRSLRCEAQLSINQSAKPVTKHLILPPKGKPVTFVPVHAVNGRSGMGVRTSWASECIQINRVLLLFLVHLRPNLIHDLQAHWRPWEEPAHCHVQIPRAFWDILDPQAGWVSHVPSRSGNAAEGAVSAPQHTQREGRVYSVPTLSPQRGRRSHTDTDTSRGARTAMIDQDTELSADRKEYKVFVQKHRVRNRPPCAEGTGARPSPSPPSPAGCPVRSPREYRW